jgi:rubrerythrin
MAGKYALYLPYKIHDALSKGGITDSEFREFITALFNYDQHGTEPAFTNSGLTMLFESIRPEIDFYHEKYEAVVEKRREAGRNGGASKSPKKVAAARENGARGGPPKGNRNAAKNKDNPPVESEMEKQPETTTTNFINECAKAGFRLDWKIAGKILTEHPIDPAWIAGEFSFPEFVADTIKESYPGKSPAEQKRLFISGFQWEDLRDKYPAWREHHRKEAEAHQRREAAEAEERRKDEARRNPPATCGHCGTVLASDNRACPSCGRMLFFDDESEAWKFQEPVNFSAAFQQYKARAGA